MRYSQLFTKTLREAPKDEVANNAIFLTRAGYIYKEMAGVYAMLPLGRRVLDKICNIIRDEINKVGGQELSMTALQSPQLWKSTKRWSDEVVDVWFKTKLKNDADLGLGFTHEEPITKMMTQYLSSYKDLPAYPYQIQTKFRNETRAKSGVMRGREFLMKDLYSFSADKAGHDQFYADIQQSYRNIFKRLGLGDLTYLTFASGGVFSKFSHEFQTVCEAGEDVIYIDTKKNIAINSEVLTDEVLTDLGVNKEDLIEKKAVEVGNIFTLGTRFSEPLGLTYKDADGKEHPVFMGSYGIGPSRLMGVIVEILADDNGIVWPVTVAPYQVQLIVLGDSEDVIAKANDIYANLQAANIEVLYDDRDARPGTKFADADLIGMPYRIVISQKTIDNNNQAEIKARSSQDLTMVPLDNVVNHVANLITVATDALCLND